MLTNVNHSSVWIQYIFNVTTQEETLKYDRITSNSEIKVLMYY